MAPPPILPLPQASESIDAYVCMYHDQGLIPVKALAFEEAVNVTLGLPIIRTSWIMEPLSILPGREKPTPAV